MTALLQMSRPRLRDTNVSSLATKPGSELLLWLQQTGFLPSPRPWGPAYTLASPKSGEDTSKDTVSPVTGTKCEHRMQEGTYD